MAAPQQFEPETRQYFNALVNISRYPNSPLVKQSINAGHYGTFNLERAQKQLLSLRSSYPQLGLGLNLTTGYHPDTFLALINQFREIRTANNRLLPELVKEAVDKNDPSLLQHFPAVLPTEKKPETVQQTPPPEFQPPPSTTQPTSSEPPKDTKTPPKKTPVRQQQQQLQHAQQPEPPEEREGERAQNEQQEQPQGNQPQQNQQQQNPQGQQNQQNQPQRNQQNQQQQRANRPQQNQPSREAEPEGGSRRIRNSRRSRRRRLRALSRGRPTPPRTGGLLDAANNYMGFRDLVSASKWLADKLGFKTLSNWLNKLLAPERWLGNLARSALNVGGQALRGAIQGALNLVPRLAMGSLGGIASTLGSWLAGAGTVAAAIIGSTAFMFTAIFAVIAAVFVITMWQAGEADKRANTECGKPGEVEVLKQHKGAGEDLNIPNRFLKADGTEDESSSNIEYEIVVIFNIRCTTAMVDVEVRDELPANTDFVESKARVNDPKYTEVVDQGTREGNAVVWRFKHVHPESDMALSLTIKPRSATNDSWIINQATATYTTLNTIPGTVGFAPNQDNCGGKYSLKDRFGTPNPLGNFGDPTCSFTKEGLRALLQQLDPAEAAYWFDKVVYKETGGTYDPNSWADPVVVGTPDAEGAWGLFQMGRGKNGQYDHGDVDWQIQTSNAVNYNNGLARPWRYWQAAQERW